MSDYSLLGIGSSSNLNADLINKLKTTELSSIEKPYNNNILQITASSNTFKDIKTKLSDFESLSSSFLNTSIYDKKSFDVSGDSVIFDVKNESSIVADNYNITVNKLAQKDLYQSELISSNSFMNLGELQITVNGVIETFDSTGKTYQDFANEINSKPGISSSFEAVSSNSYRLVIKSENTGVDNALSISGTVNDTLKFTSVDNHKLMAQNSDIDINGVNYQLSTNELSSNGITINAVKTGNASLNVVKDTNNVVSDLNSLFDKYNNIINEIKKAKELGGNNSSLNSIEKELKNTLFDKYNGKSLFQLGVNLDKNGMLSLADDFNVDNFKSFLYSDGFLKAMNDNVSNIVKNVDSMINKNNEFVTLETKTFENQKIKLDSKYRDLSSQFSQYNSIINSFESSFQSLKMMIQMNSSN